MLLQNKEGTNHRFQPILKCVFVNYYMYMYNNKLTLGLEDMIMLDNSLGIQM